MDVKHTKSALDILLGYTLKEALLNKLEEKPLQEIASYALTHHTQSNLQQILITLCSMEINGKRGAAFLANEEIANTTQLKNLTAEQIIAIHGDYLAYQDPVIARNAVKNAIIDNQQQMLHERTSPNFRKLRSERLHKEL